MQDRIKKAEEMFKACGLEPKARINAAWREVTEKIRISPEERKGLSLTVLEERYYQKHKENLHSLYQMLQGKIFEPRTVEKAVYSYLVHCMMQDKAAVKEMILTEVYHKALDEMFLELYEEYEDVQNKAKSSKLQAQQFKEQKCNGVLWILYKTGYAGLAEEAIAWDILVKAIDAVGEMRFVLHSALQAAQMRVLENIEVKEEISHE